MPGTRPWVETRRPASAGAIIVGMLGMTLVAAYLIPRLSGGMESA